MGTSTELLQAEAWMQNILQNDATLAAQVPGGWWNGAAPTGVASPYGTYLSLSATDVLGVAGNRRMTQALYLVTINAQAVTPARLVVGANRMDVLLQGKFGTTADTNIDYCIRERP